VAPAITQLAPGHLIGAGGARRGDLIMPAQAAAPILSLLVALAGIDERTVLAERDVVVGIDQTSTKY
jgi:hypothetical protein